MGLGQTLAAGAEVAQVVDIEDEIDVLCFVSQHDAARLDVNQPAGLGGLDDKPDEVRTADAAGRVVYYRRPSRAGDGLFRGQGALPQQGPQPARQRGAAAPRPDAARPGSDLAVPEAALLEDQDPPSVIIVEELKTEKNADGEDEQTGTVRRMRAKVGVRDRVKKKVAIVGLKEHPEDPWQGDLDKVQFVTKNGQGLETGDSVRLEEEEE